MSEKKFYHRGSSALNFLYLLAVTAIVVTLVTATGDQVSTDVAEPDDDIGAEQAPRYERVERYENIILTGVEHRDLAAIIYLEARNQPAEGQQAVAEVILNRVVADNFPNKVQDVIRQGADTKRPQFSTIGMLSEAEPQQEQYDAIMAALYGPSILDTDVVYFSRGGENSRTWGTIGDHVFCRQYQWE